MGSSITLAWTTIAGEELGILDESAAANDGCVVRVDLATLGRSILPLLAAGPVVVVVGTDREASLALAFGADEVLRAGELTRASLDAAIASSRARATGRAARDASHGSYAHEWTAFSLLIAALGNELAPAIMVALTNSELLASSLGPVLDVGDEFVSWAALVTPTEHLRRLVARRTAAPTSDELIAMAGDARAALARASALLRVVREITFQEDGSTSVSAQRVIADLRTIIANYMGVRAEFEVETSGPCVVKAPRHVLTCLIVSLLSEALDALRTAHRDPGRIRLSASEQEECVAIELWYEAPARKTDLRPGVLDPYFGGDRGASLSGLAGVRERVRQLGGDLLIDGDAAATTVRVFLPTATDECVTSVLPSGWSHVSRNRSDRSD